MIVINGFESLKSLKQRQKVVSLKEYLAVLIIPMIRNPFALTLCCVPKHNLDKSSYDLIFKFLQSLCMSHQIKLQAITGDGDTKYRQFNKSPDFGFICPVNGSYFESLAHLVISPDYFFNPDDKWVAQDVLHGAKKLRNALRAVTARFMIFGPPQYYSSLASWSILYELWIDNNWHTDIKIVSMKSSVDYKDRQDPTLPYDVAKLFFIIDELNKSKTFMSLYLELIVFVLEAFYEHKLNILQRIFRIWYVKSFIKMWRLWLVKYGHTLNNHFISSTTYDDINSVCDGFLCLLLYTHHNNLCFCPHMFSSDHPEQAFCFCRIARYSGRRTNISGSDLIDGLERRNRSVEVDSSTNMLDPEPIAHARSRNILDQESHSSFDVQQSRSVTLEDVVITMNKATNYAYYQACQLKGVTLSDHFCDPSLGKTEASALRVDFKLDTSKDRVMAKIKKKLNVHEAMNLDVSMAIYGNGGRTNLPSASRASRFYGYVFQEVSLEVICDHDGHRSFSIGDIFHGPDGHTGKILAMGYKKHSRGLAYPTKTMCKCTGTFRVIWVKVKVSKGHTKVIKYKL